MNAYHAAIRQAVLNLSEREQDFSKERLRTEARRVFPLRRSEAYGEFTRALANRLGKWERSGILTRWTNEKGLEMVRVHERARLAEDPSGDRVDT